MAACGSKGSEPGHERGHNAQRPANAGATPSARDDWGRPARTSFVPLGAGGRPPAESALLPESGRRADIRGRQKCQDRDITGLGAHRAGAATLAASSCNGRDQRTRMASNQYPLGQPDPYPQSSVEYVAASLTRRLMYGDCATPDRRQWQLSLLSIEAARPCTPRLICFRNWRMTTGDTDESV